MDFSLESMMKKFIQELDGRRNLEAITLQGHLKSAAVAFKCHTTDIRSQSSPAIPVLPLLKTINDFPLVTLASHSTY